MRLQRLFAVLLGLGSGLTSAATLHSHPNLTDELDFAATDWHLPPLNDLGVPANTSQSANVTKVRLPGPADPKSLLTETSKRAVDTYTLTYAHGGVNLTNGTWLYGLPIPADELHELLRGALVTTPQRSRSGRVTFLSFATQTWRLLIRPVSPSVGDEWQADWTNIATILNAAALTEQNQTRTFAGVVSDAQGRPVSMLAMIPAGTRMENQTDIPATAQPSVRPRASTDLRARDEGPALTPLVLGYAFNAFRSRKVVYATTLMAVLQYMSNLVLVWDRWTARVVTDFSTNMLHTPGDPSPLLQVYVEMLEDHYMAGPLLKSLIAGIVAWVVEDSAVHGILNSQIGHLMKVQGYMGVIYDKHRNPIAVWGVN
ncbi:MAG: hypothetical protein M1817_002320 [Caeruleum heppii]|nr:MAG: hypothetical protein M1817_003495 [Caeruleum heppii]KAI9673682.1 MAG: hypothetical protein M1817_002320 [Caeruleum heppii]